MIVPGQLLCSRCKCTCKGVRKKRRDIESLPPVVMIQVGEFDYNNCKVACMNDIEHRLLIQGKYYILVQVNLHGGHHFRGITAVESGRYIMYDGMASFGKGKRRVKYINGKTLFNTGSGRGNEYYVASLWYKKEDLPKKGNNPHCGKKIRRRWRRRRLKCQNGLKLNTGYKNQRIAINIIHPI